MRSCSTKHTENRPFRCAFRLSRTSRKIARDRAWPCQDYLEQSRITLSKASLFPKQDDTLIRPTLTRTTLACALKFLLLVPKHKNSRLPAWANLRVLSEYIVSKHIVCQERHCMTFLNISPYLKEISRRTKEFESGMSGHIANPRWSPGSMLTAPRHPTQLAGQRTKRDLSRTARSIARASTTDSGSCATPSASAELQACSTIWAIS